MNIFFIISLSLVFMFQKCYGAKVIVLLHILYYVINEPLPSLPTPRRLEALTRSETLKYVTIGETIISKYLKRCQFQVPDKVLSECIGDAMEDALRTLKNGEPALGIQPLDPLRVEKLDILQGGDRPVSLSIHHRNLDITGISQCKVQENDISKVDGTLKGRMSCPKLILYGDYELDGRVLVLPVQGKGKSTITLENNVCEYMAHGEFDSRKGMRYLKYSKIDFSITPQKMILNFENLFGGDKSLARTVNEFINENWKEILNEMKPSYEAVFSTVFKDTVNRVFSRIPVKNILPDYEEA